MSPSSTFHPEGMSTDTIAGDLLCVWSWQFKEANHWMMPSKGRLGSPTKFTNMVIGSDMCVSEPRCQPCMEN